MVSKEELRKLDKEQLVDLVYDLLIKVDALTAQVKMLQAEVNWFEKSNPADDHEKEMEKMFAKIGQLEMERDFLKKNLKKLGL
jgi:hypothetical protein